jgi:hypothetical protein
MSGWPVVGTTLLAAFAGGATGYLSQRAAAAAQAKVDYTSNARKRLYEAVGPLRFQLLIACRDVERRVSLHLEAKAWVLDPAQYYGRSFIYRLLRPLAIGMLIERQMSYADFSVDKSSIDLLRFNTAAYRVLTGVDPLPYYSGLDFRSESQHIFSDNLRAAASALLSKGFDGGTIIMDFAQFSLAYPDPHVDARLAPLALLFDSAGTSLTSRPVFWTRLVSYGYVCQQYLERHGAELGFGTRPLDVRSLLAAADDPQIRGNLMKYPEVLDRVILQGL